MHLIDESKVIRGVLLACSRNKSPFGVFFMWVQTGLFPEFALRERFTMKIWVVPSGVRMILWPFPYPVRALPDPKEGELDRRITPSSLGSSLRAWRDIEDNFLAQCCSMDHNSTRNNWTRIPIRLQVLTPICTSTEDDNCSPIVRTSLSLISWIRAEHQWCVIGRLNCTVVIRILENRHGARMEVSVGCRSRMLQDDLDF